MRGAEARQILGSMRKLAYLYRLQYGTVDGITNSALGIGTAADQIPGPTVDNCRSSHYFYYGFTPMGGPSIQLWGYRCYGGNGKAPSGTVGHALNIQTNLATGTDTWFNSGGAPY
jgi:hypothetical protein